jgi:hypothetical protein
MPVKKNIVEDIRKQRPGLYSVMLLMGSWQQHIGNVAAKILIAGVLNECTESKGLRIRGYWMTDERTYLVLWLCEDAVKDTMNIFEKHLRETLHHYNKQEHPHEALPLFGLFTYHRFFYADLTKLLTGKNIDRPYYDPRLQRLKSDLKRADYCSLVDYSGATGPVIVNLSTDKNE